MEMKSVSDFLCHNNRFNDLLFQTNRLNLNETIDHINRLFISIHSNVFGNSNVIPLGAHLHVQSQNLEFIKELIK